MNIFTKSSLLQKLKNKIPPCTFPMKVITSVFDEVKLAVYGSENSERFHF